MAWPGKRDKEKEKQVSPHAWTHDTRHMTQTTHGRPMTAISPETNRTTHAGGITTSPMIFPFLFFLHDMDGSDFDVMNGFRKS